LKKECLVETFPESFKLLFQVTESLLHLPEYPVEVPAEFPSEDPAPVSVPVSVSAAGLSVPV
jgi:hypothetical protein